MASLVADYSDSESEHEDECTDDKIEETSEVRIKEEPNISTLNFFLPTDNGSDNDDDDSKCDTVTVKLECKTTVKLESAEKLPNPLSDGVKKLPSIFEATTSRIGTSVFINPFEQAEQAKNQILEKHVKLTQAAPKKPANKPVCWKFKRGTCHLGKNCRFFHDRENVTLEENIQTINPTSSGQEHSQRQVYHPSAYFDARRRPLEQEPIDEDSYMAGMGKKRRFGVSDHLMPPKKAFESLLRQREVERPWTLPQN